jgi:hypothetical protein
MSQPNKQLLTAVWSTLALLMTGPIILILSIMLLGANPLDGLFGVDENTPLQQGSLNLGIFATLVGWFIAVLMTLYFSITRRNSDKRYFGIFGMVLLIPLFLYLLWYRA